MRYSALLTLFIAFSVTSADAQVKKGGLFGFGSDDDQISADLFPTTPGSTTMPSSPASQPTRDDDGIFRSGEPADIDAVSYVIENGEKIEKKVEPKKKGLFSFGRKADKKEGNAIAPVPVAEYTQPTNVIEVPAEVSEAPAVVEETVQEVVEDTSTAVMEAVNEPVVEEKKKSGGLFGFFGKKSEDVPEAPAFTMSDEVSEVEEAVADVTEANPYQEPAPTVAPAAPAPAETAPAPVAADPVPQFAGMEPQPKPEKEGFSFPSIPNPIAKMRSQREEKTIDLTGAETIIQNGEIVEGAEDIVESNIVETGDGVRQPPRVVDGVTTYSSWDDIEARSVSAADRILNQIR